MTDQPRLLAKVLTVSDGVIAGTRTDTGTSIRVLQEFAWHRDEYGVVVARATSALPLAAGEQERVEETARRIAGGGGSAIRVSTAVRDRLGEQFSFRGPIVLDGDGKPRVETWEVTG